MRESGGCALVHCVAGISRSPSLVIGYLMQTLRLPFDDAFKYVLFCSLGFPLCARAYVPNVQFRSLCAHCSGQFCS